MSQTITHHFVASQKRNPKLAALKYKKKNTWKAVKWKEYFQNSEKIGAALLSQDVVKGDRVAILSNTRPEWAFSDMGILGIGAITVPIYQSYRPDEIEYILNNSESKILICENDHQYKKWLEIKGNCTSVQSVVIIEGGNESVEKKDFTWTHFLESGSSHLKNHPGCYNQACLNNTLDDVATILYTSGTTGEPKGVVLEHRQIMSQITDAFGAMSVGSSDNSLSFLPYAHILGRVELWGNIYSGFTICFAESIDRIRQNLKEVRPTLMIAVPRIFEKIYNGVLAQAESSELKNKIFQWAVEVGEKVSVCKRSKTPVPLSVLSKYIVAKKLVFDKFNDKLGGRIRFAISGGAPLSKEIAEFFHAANFLILEGYGLTETTAAICLNTPFNYMFGSVGKPLANVDIKIAEDGEILIKSDKVMREYYRRPEETKKVFIDGYFATGDIGEFTPEGFLKITDRKKDLIKTAGGKYVAPQKLEGLLKLNKYISNVLIHGDQKKYIVALLTLDIDAAKTYALENQISYQNPSTLAQNSKIQELLRDAVAEVNMELSSFESIKNFHILGDDFTVENGELTPSLKVKRKYCDRKYGHLINGLYGIDKGTL